MADEFTGPEGFEDFGASADTARNAQCAIYKDQVVALLRARGFAVEVIAAAVATSGPFILPYNYELHITKDGFTAVRYCGWMAVDRWSVEQCVTLAIQNWNWSRSMALQPDTAAQIGVPVYIPPPGVSIAFVPATPAEVAAAQPAPVAPAGPGQLTQTVPDVPVEHTPGPVPGTQTVEVVMPPETATAEATLRDQIYDLAVGTMGKNTMNWDEWNWFFTQVTGAPGPWPEQYGLVRVEPMPAMSYSAWADKVLASQAIDQQVLMAPELPVAGAILPAELGPGMQAILEQILALIKVLLYGRSS